MRYDGKDLWLLFWGFANVLIAGVYNSLLALIVGVICVLVGTAGVQATYLKRNKKEIGAEENS